MVGKYELGQLSSENLPAPISVDAESMWFRFTSDKNGNRKGFSLTWNATGESVCFCFCIDVVVVVILVLVPVLYTRTNRF